MSKIEGDLGKKNSNRKRAQHVGPTNPMLTQVLICMQNSCFSAPKICAYFLFTWTVSHIEDTTM